jgi:hypothetical protein
LGTDRHLGGIDDGCKTESRVKSEAVLGLHAQTGTNQKAEMEKIAQITRDKIVSVRMHGTGAQSPTMTQQVVTVTYDLVVPDGTHRPKPEPSTSHTRPVAPSASGGHKEYYDALRAAIDEIKEVTGHELTAWKDAVGNGELGKEANVKKGDDEDGSEGGGAGEE